MTIHQFEDLTVWKESLNLAIRIYSVTTSYPKSELFGLTNQMRRASSSIGANIAEGFGRYSQKEKLQFYYISRGSLLELKHFLYLSKELNYISLDQLKAIQQMCDSLLKSLHAYGKQLKEYTK